MKKTYMTPTAVVVEIAIKNQLMYVSGGMTGIGYGGVDIEGTKDPASRVIYWDEDEE